MRYYNVDGWNELSDFYKRNKFDNINEKIKGLEGVLGKYRGIVKRDVTKLKLLENSYRRKAEEEYWKKLINVDMPKAGKITDKTVEVSKEASKRYRTSMRVATGRVWTDDDYEERREQILNTPLP